ncbi:hypothetical protein CsSME_00046527 [Camellia sinensis var. sinensis]
MSNSTRCAACKSLRRRCSQDCVLALYFPANNAERFSCVHKIFGTSNVTMMLEQLPIQSRAEAADCMVMEASSRIQDPIYGCTKTIFELQQQIIQTQYEIAKIQCQIAICCAQQQMNNHQQLVNQQNQYQQQQPPWMMMNANHNHQQQEEEEQLHLDHHQQLSGSHHHPQF